MALARLGAARPHRPLASPRWLDSAYIGVTRLFTQRGWVALLALAILLAGGWLLYARIGTDFLPEMDEGSIILDYWTPPGTSLTDTDRMLDEVEKVIVSLPDVAGYSRRTGTQLGFFITEPNTGSGTEYRATALATWMPSEFQRIRAQVAWDRLPGARDGFEALVHLEFIIGAHGAHPF